MAEPWEERYDRLDALLTRTASIVASLATTVNQHDAQIARLAESAVHHEERMDAHQARMEHLESQHEARMERLDRQHEATMIALAQIVDRLDTLLARLIRQEPNGRGA